MHRMCRGTCKRLKSVVLPSLSSGKHPAVMVDLLCADTSSNVAKDSAVASCESAEAWSSITTTETRPSSRISTTSIVSRPRTTQDEATGVNRLDPSSPEICLVGFSFNISCVVFKRTLCLPAPFSLNLSLLYACCKNCDKLRGNIRSPFPTDIPWAPNKPQIAGITRTTVALSWMPPQNDGGSPVTNYVIESKASSAVGWSVCNIGQQVSSPHFTAFGLIEGTTYQFRVSAENRVGRSEASHPTDSVVVREPISECLLLIADYSFV